MRALHRPLLLLLALFGLVAATLPAAATPAARPYHVTPLRQAHAHNDYEHVRPLHDALDHGFTSVEADIFLVDGDLLVAHDPEDVDPTARCARCTWIRCGRRCCTAASTPAAACRSSC